jgi:hypothetical protein
MPKRAIRTVHVGLGPIGISVVRALQDRPEIEIVGVVDIDPSIVGRGLGELAGVKSHGIVVSRSLEEVGPPGTADVVVLSTGSFLHDGVTRQVTDALSWGASVISTCEELAFPWRHHHDEARIIDEAAREAGQTVLAAGINPGFAMDLLVLYATGVSEVVSSVRVHRVVDATKRRLPLQRKIGVGISRDEFDARRKSRAIGHVGLVQSVAMLDAGLGLGVDAIEEQLEPVITRERLENSGSPVEAGRVVGIRQVAHGFSNGLEVVSVELEMYLGAPNPCDKLELRGSPDLSLTLLGVEGDTATASVIANGIPTMPLLPVGLATVIDLAPLRWAGSVQPAQHRRSPTRLP